MVEKALHAGNLSACVTAVVTAVDISLSGGATLAFSGALSAVEVFKGLSRSQQAVAQKMAKKLDAHLKKIPLSGDRKKIVVQLISDHPPSEADILANGEDAEKIARAMAERVHESTTDPSQKSSQALEDYKMALVALLTPALAPKDRNEARDQETLRASQATRDMVQDLSETLTEEIRAQQEDQFKRLVEELKRQSNLPFDVERERSAAKVAIEKKRYDDARNNLERAAEITRNSADQANLDYARSLAALGALAFTVSDFAGARLQYSKALSIPGLEKERRANYKRSYLIASNAVIARQCTYTEGRKVLDEMVADGVRPNEVTYSTLINLAPNYAEGRKVLDEMVADGVRPNEVTYNTLINLAPNYAEGRKLLDEMVADGVRPNEVTYSTLINLAPNYAEGRKLLDEMVADGVRPDEVTLVTLLKIGATFHQACDLAHYARNPDREWFTGRGFYTALFARPIDHLSADELLGVYSDMPFKFDTALENPIRQYRRTRQQEQALSLAMRFPYLPASAKFFRERMDFCLPEFATRVSAGEDEEDLHYAYGVAAQLAEVWDLAREQLSIALEMATAEARLADIERRLLAVAERRRD